MQVTCVPTTPCRELVVNLLAHQRTELFDARNSGRGMHSWQGGLT